jgi:hypothetical protein
MGACIPRQNWLEVLAFFVFSLNDMCVSDNPNEIAGRERAARAACSISGAVEKRANRNG